MTTEIFPCGILHDSGPQPPDDHGCILPDNHEGPHEYIARDGVAWQWETNLECDCEWCRRCEGDYCTIYWRKADSAGEREYQSWLAALAASAQEPDALAALAASAQEPDALDGFDGLAQPMRDGYVGSVVTSYGGNHLVTVRYALREQADAAQEWLADGGIQRSRQRAAGPAGDQR
jgi:hypothetical protein